MWEELLQKIYQHYPIGAYRYKDTYPGYVKMKEMVERKIDQEADDPRAAGAVFHRHLQERMPGFTMLDFNHFMFPNYVSVAELGKDKKNKKKDSCWLYICVSMLCDYYTLFVANTYSVHNYKEKDKNEKLAAFAGFNIVSFERQYCPYEYADIELVKAVLKVHFPAKEYVSHKALQMQTIRGGIPFGLGQDEDLLQEKYTFLDYLFLNNFAGQTNITFDY